MQVDAIPVGINPPTDINVIIEVPIGGDPVKYELDKTSGTLVVDRFLYTPMVYPGNYGFIPQTLSDDGDPIDVLVANMRPVIPGAVINCRPIGVLIMEDDAGVDEKIIAVPSVRVTPRYNQVREYLDLPSIVTEKIEFFFAHYKDLEPGKWVKIQTWEGTEKAQELIQQSVERVQLEKSQLASQPLDISLSKPTFPLGVS